MYIPCLTLVKRILTGSFTALFKKNYFTNAPYTKKEICKFYNSYRGIHSLPNPLKKLCCQENVSA